MQEYKVNFFVFGKGWTDKVFARDAAEARKKLQEKVLASLKIVKVEEVETPEEKLERELADDPATRHIMDTIFGGFKK